MRIIISNLNRKENLMCHFDVEQNFWNKVKIFQIGSLNVFISHFSFKSRKNVDSANCSRRNTKYTSWLFPFLCLKFTLRYQIFSFKFSVTGIVMWSCTKLCSQQRLSCTFTINCLLRIHSDLFISTWQNYFWKLYFPLETFNKNKIKYI